mmetsp:Transcript_28115/g.57662  ORF Transcript_28115/g.57662 Transcript_28115/m.57662 type:complete len:144 (+) Transcript_28115:142-573(+)|eukprot:CAMPEP_0171599884 /NCGR_PEP_ID=MMETSP0990-20121206/3999_1 /TAXON_ID=483369 /ORGANISM="non described non described, Strain CCMP2098" /LENGTH=143 /DNA_ID=CAMNT_0012161747 /DNA_START=82 /DNA_END=513 /DNA_ORIENTATION=+
MQEDDGYFYRDSSNKTHGPLENMDFQSLRKKGVIKSSFKVWRQKGGNIFKVNLERKFTLGRILSLQSCGHFFELLMISSCLVMMVWIFRAPKLQKELGKEGSDATFLKVLLFVTLLMTLFTIRTNLKRLGDSSSTLEAVEPPV